MRRDDPFGTLKYLKKEKLGTYPDTNSNTNLCIIYGAKWFKKH